MLVLASSARPVWAGKSSTRSGVLHRRRDIPARILLMERVLLPSGDVIMVRQASASHDGQPVRYPPSEPADAGLTEATVQLVQVPGFVETIGGVLESIRMAIRGHEPDSVDVEFGIEVSAATGVVLSPLGDLAGKAHLKISASWRPEGNHQ